MAIQLSLLRCFSVSAFLLYLSPSFLLSILALFCSLVSGTGNFLFIVASIVIQEDSDCGYTIFNNCCVAMYFS